MSLKYDDTCGFFLHLASRAPASNDVGSPKKMLTPLSNLTHNPAARESEAGNFLLLIRIVPIVCGAQ